MIITRSQWGAIDAPLGNVMSQPATSVTAHHPFPHSTPIGASLTQEARELRAIQKFHIEGNGWKNIGYSFVITQNGNVYEGRGWGRVGAHAGTTVGNNTSYGIAFMIDGNREAPSTLAKLSFKALRADGIRLNFLTPDHTLKFHWDWHSTDCPGRVLADALKAEEGTRAPRARILKLGMSGPDVKELQKLLKMEGRHQTGFFGTQTAKALRNFQHDNGLQVDGIAGPITMQKLRS